MHAVTGENGFYTLVCAFAKSSRVFSTLSRTLVAMRSAADAEHWPADTAEFHSGQSYYYLSAILISGF